MFIAGVNDTGDKLLAGEQLSPVTTTPAINLSPVTTTPVIRHPDILPQARGDTNKRNFYCVQAMSTCVTLVLTLIPFTATAAPTLIDIKGTQK
jgi:hypothetical protein